MTSTGTKVPRPTGRRLAPADVTVFVDSRAGLEYAWANGVPRSARVRTASPNLLRQGDITAEPLDPHIDAEVLMALGRDCHALALSLFEALRADEALARYALSVARAVAGFQRVLYKAMALSEDDYRNPVVSVDVAFATEIGNDRYNHPFSRLLGTNPHFRRLVFDGGDAFPEVWHTEAPFLKRLRFEDWQSVAYRVLTHLSARLPGFIASREVLILSENTLVKEAALRLAMDGAALRLLDRPQPARKPLEAEAAAALVEAVEGELREWVAGRVTPSAVPVLIDWFLDMARERMERLRAAREAWPAQVFEASSRKPRVVLAGDVPSPETEALYELCREEGLPFCTFQHGTGVELSDAALHSEFLREVCAGDVHFTFNEAIKGRFERNPFAVAKSITVGMPADLAGVGKRRLGPAGLPPVFYVSGQLFMGNWQYPASTGIPDWANADYEARIVDEVLARLPHRILFKPYASIRYLDPHPVVERARGAANIEVYDEWQDLRYLIGRARLLIVSHGGSTVSWCLMSGLPVVFIDAPYQAQLRPQVRADFEKAVFLFDAGEADFHARLRDFLSRPLEEIEGQWRERAPARRAAVERWLGRADGAAGRRAARHIRELERR